MNNELPKVDVTYGTKRYNNRIYKTFYTSLVPAVKGQCSVKVLDIDGNEFVSNVIKTNNRNGVVVFSDHRMLFCQIAKIELIGRQEMEIIESQVKNFDSSVLSKPRTFHLILKKSHALNKDVAVFMKDGNVYKGKSIRQDYDTLLLITQEDKQLIIMYDAVKRIVPLEGDGSLAE
ncbi:hypothetical protein [Xenorhabdus bovienii]|uniref:hypothetical protein n=1 Tax=Xenorhabdus bovienii TaxID=40576 RepID=UPI0023B353CA|nr:hypothetical protein [Xenorhabdus bovienii]MDE9454593.1 hypothetical protein [Xenorhabdus bovienii]